MVKMLGIIMILGGSTAVSMTIRSKYLKRIRALEQIILALEIFERELKFNYETTPNIIKKLSKNLKYPLCNMFFELHKFIQNNDDLSLEYKWIKIFRDYSDIVGFNKVDTNILVDMSNFLGKYDVLEQIKAINYYKTLLNSNLSEAKEIAKNEGKITKTVLLSASMIIIIVLA